MPEQQLTYPVGRQSQPYAFREPLLNQFIRFGPSEIEYWTDQGHALLTKKYPLKKSPTPQLSDVTYTGFFYYEIEFRKRSRNIDNHRTEGSA